MFSNTTMKLIEAWTEGADVVNQLHDSLLEDGYEVFAWRVLNDECFHAIHYRSDCDISNAYKIQMGEHLPESFDDYLRSSVNIAAKLGFQPEKYVEREFI